MKKYKKWLFLFSIIGAFIPVLPCEAKVETTTEVQLIDMGHGIWVPASFDVVDEYGNFVTLSEVDASYCEMQEIDEESYSITLENGYRAEKQWIYETGVTDKAYKRTTVYDESGNIVFVLGCDAMGQVQFGMQDDKGNYVKNTYTRSVLTDAEKDTYETRSIANEDGTAIKALTRVTYNKEERVSKTYKKWGDIMQLDEKYDYKAEGGGTCTVYGKVNPYYNGYDQEDEYYESFSYKKEDIQEYPCRTIVHLIGMGQDIYTTELAKLPSKVTQNGEELYIYWLENYFEDADWTESSKKVEEILAGRPIDQNFYFTKEQIAILETEGITSVDDLMKTHPEFMDTFGGFTDTYYGKYEESEAAKKEREAKEAIISPDVETDAEPEYDGKWKTLEDGTRVCWQDLTGDVVPVNGLVPTKIMTQEFETPNGMYQSAILYDDSGNIVMHCILYDITHTNYKYVYLTSVDLAVNMAEIAGTDTPVSGNLDYLGETTYDTENGQVTGEVYGQY